MLKPLKYGYFILKTVHNDTGVYTTTHDFLTCTDIAVRLMLSEDFEEISITPKESKKEIFLYRKNRKLKIGREFKNLFRKSSCAIFRA